MQLNNGNIQQLNLYVIRSYKLQEIELAVNFFNFMSILHDNVFQLGWGVLHYGIRASGSNTVLGLALTNVSLTNLLLQILSVMNLGKYREKQSDIPKFVSKI
jgi:hypothetical protein